MSLFKSQYFSSELILIKIILNLVHNIELIAYTIVYLVILILLITIDVVLHFFAIFCNTKVKILCNAYSVFVFKDYFPMADPQM